MNNFDSCLQFVLKEEGGNDDDPHDHGGRTSRGITQREWDKFRLTHPDRPEDVWKASDADIKTIYHDEYWMPHCPSLPSGLDLLFFDFKVNAGPKRATETLQKVLGISADGIFGEQTTSAIQSVMLNADLINKYADYRLSFYKSLAQYSRYGKGWSSRNERARHAALAMISATPESPKANPADTKPNVVHGPAASTVVIAAGTAAAAHYHSPLIFLGVIVAAVAIGLGVHYFVNRKV